MRRALGGPPLALLLLSGLLSGCGGPDPEPAADRAAKALAGLDVSKVRFAGADADEATAEVKTLLGGMAGTPVKVAVGALKTDGDRATGRLTWTWDLGGKDWTVRAPLRMTKVGDAWRVVWSRDLVDPDLPAGQRLRAVAVRADRGKILGAGGQPIVVERRVLRYGIDKSRVPLRRAVASARALAALVDVSPGPLVKQVRAAGAKAYVAAITLRQDDPDVPDASRVEAIPGALVVRTTLPLAPTRDFAAPILGTVGLPTAEMVKAAKGKLDPTAQVGLSGLQKRYDDQLAGTDGVAVQRVDERGTTTTVVRTAPVGGKSLRLTMDVRAQTLAEEALAGTTSPSALVALRPSTGAILAAASGPAGQGYNTATYGRYAPGSTFKVVSSLALLRSGVTPDTTVDCPSRLTVDGKGFKNYDDYPSSALGRIPFREAIANSCNTAVIGQRDRLAKDTLADAAAALGVGVDHDLGFPAYFGSVPPAASEVEGAADLIGQGKVQASPLAMAAVAASVQRGSTVVPRLIADRETPPVDAPAHPLTTQEADQLRGLMRGVVTEGSGRLLLDVPGPPVRAKTGTAEYGEGAPLRTHAWMIAGQGDLAVAVFVEDGQSGSGTAGPILERFLRGVR